MYKEPKNTYEMAMNEVYQNAEQYINNKTYAGLEPITANLETIYRKLSYEQQQEFADNFYQLFCLTDTEDEEY